MASGTGFRSLLLSLPAVFLLFSGLTPTTSAACNRDDRKALLAIKSFWGNPSLLSSWNSATACCDWPHVSCADADRVTSLQITDTNLTGGIPQAITKLPFLTDIILNNNRFTGSIPSSLAALSKLQYINLSNNRLTGSIPPELSSLTQLDYLSLDRNRLTGPIPYSFGKLRSEFILILSNNLLTGALPRSLGSVDFRYLDLSRNRLSGDASFLFRPVETLFLQRFVLSWNSFRFDLGKVQFPTELARLEISHNQIYGRIPEQIANLTLLDTLDVSYNNLCGKIPTGPIMERFGESSYVNNRCLCGKPLPPCK